MTNAASARWSAARVVAGAPAAGAGPTGASPAGVPQRLRIDALDGMRGLCCAAVLAYHVGWIGGGFLGVTSFLVLSGFLICHRAMDEIDRRGTFAVGDFLRRRWRRLAPLAAFGIAVSVALVGLRAGLRFPHWRSDVLASLGYVQNWNLVAHGTSYGAAFGPGTLLEHYWSLGVEEQAYLLVALALWWVAGARSSRRAVRLTAVLAITAIAAEVARQVAASRGATSFAYFATPSRIGEFAVGGLAAMAARAWRARLRSAQGSRSPWTRAGWGASALGFAAVAVVALLCWRATLHGEGVYRGGFLVTALATGAALVAASSPHRTTFTAVLCLRPLRWLGHRSYGIYLLHWPVVLLLADLGLTRRRWWSELAVVASLAAAALAHRLVDPAPTVRADSPERVRAPLGWRAVPLAGVILTGLVVLPVSPVDHELDQAALVAFPYRDQHPSSGTATGATATATTGSAGGAVAQRSPSSSPAGTAPGEAPVSPTAPAATATAVPPPPVEVVLYGDSTAFRTGWGLAAWGHDTGRMHVAELVTPFGCGLIDVGEFRYGTTKQPVDGGCRSRLADLDATLASHPEVHTVVVQFGPLDAADHRLPGQRAWRALGDPSVDELLSAKIDATLDLLQARGVHVAWLSSPIIQLGRLETPPPRTPYPASDPARMHRFDELLHSALTGRVGAIEVDLAGHLASLPGGELDPALRPDGVHFTEATATTVAAWLGPAVLAATASLP